MMIRAFFASSVFSLWLVVSVHAQQNDKLLKYQSNKRFIKGYVIDLEGKKSNGLIDRGERSIIFIDSIGNETKYKTSTIKYFFVEENEGRKFISDGSRFLTVIQEGPEIGLYMWYSFRLSQNLLFLKKRSGKDFFYCPQGNFRDRFVPYFKDCPMLSEKIAKKELGFADLDEILNIYNYKCEFK